MLGNPRMVKTKVTTSSAVGVASVQLVAANPLRLGFTIWNNANNTRYVTLGPVSSSASPTFIVGAFSSFIWPYPDLAYTGAISAIGNAGSGTMTITEFLETSI